MKNKIMVKCIEGFTLYKHDKKTISAEVEENREYEAELYELTQEYFAKDKEGREFLVGEINIDEDLTLEYGFKLCDSDKVFCISVTDELGYHELTSNCFVVKCKECSKERELNYNDIENNKINPIKCECGGENKFHYWLDSIYSEEEYEKLIEKSKKIADVDRIKILDVIKNDSNKISLNLLKLKLHIGTIKANKIIERLLDEGIIEKYNVGLYKLCS